MAPEPHPGSRARREEWHLRRWRQLMWAAVAAFVTFIVGSALLMVGEPSGLRWAAGGAIAAAGAGALWRIEKALLRLPRRHR